MCLLSDIIAGYQPHNGCLFAEWVYEAHQQKEAQCDFYVLWLWIHQTKMDAVIE